MWLSRVTPADFRDPAGSSVLTVALLMKGGVVMVPLLVSSVAALAVVLERAWFSVLHDGKPVHERCTAGCP